MPKYKVIFRYHSGLEEADYYDAPNITTFYQKFNDMYFNNYVYKLLSSKILFKYCI